MTDALVSASRLIPGAPPPAKSQRKKRKTGAKSKTPGSPAEGSVTIPDDPSPALPDSTPNETDVKEDVPVAPSEAPTLEDLSLKSSPVIELVQKRMRSLNKKISRIASYASTDHEKLNDDQKRTLKTLSSLECVYKELEEVKKSIEIHEAEVARDQALKRAETERTQSQKVEEALSNSQERFHPCLSAFYISKASSILTLLRLRSALASADAPPVALDFDESEGSVIFTVCDALMGEENDTKHTVLSGLISGEGDFNGVPYTRLSDIVQSFLNPPREPTPLPTEPEQVEVETETATETETETGAEAAPVGEPVAGIPGSLNASSSFHFMQVSELETPTFENDAEWVDKPEVEPNGASEEQAQVVEDVSIEPVETSTQPIDWAEADEEGGLPSIANLQASFAPSGSATPVVQTIEVNLPSSAPLLNGDAFTSAPQTEDDGFTPTSRGGRGRGRGYRGDRGGVRGGFRGDRTGFHRGGERGGFRGNRGGDRAHRPNRLDGDWRNGDGERRSGDGEHRGRGRGRGRGRNEGGERRGSGQQEPRSGPPPL